MTFGRAEEPAGPERWHRLGQRVPNCALRRPGAGSPQLRARADADGLAILAGRGGDDTHRLSHCVPRHQQRAVDLVRWGIRVDGLRDLRDDALPFAAPISVKEPFSEHS